MYIYFSFPLIQSPANAGVKLISEGKRGAMIDAIMDKIPSAIDRRRERVDYRSGLRRSLLHPSKIKHTPSLRSETDACNQTAHKAPEACEGSVRSRARGARGKEG